MKQREEMILACLQRHQRRWARLFACRHHGPGYHELLQWFEDRGNYLRSEYRALVDHEFKLPSR